MRISLSPYTMATNCTDITDCNDGISELWDACDRYKAAGQKVPEYIYKRIEKLEAKRDKCSLKEHGMKYDEWLLSRFDKLEGASDGYIEAYKEALKKWLKYQNYKGDKRNTVYHILRDNADSAREFLMQAPQELPNFFKINAWYFDEDITDYNTMVERIFGGLQGTKKAPKKQTDSWYIDNLRHKFFMQLVTKARVKVEVAQELSLMAVDAMVEFGQWKNRQYESPENTTDRLKAHEILCRITDKLLDKRIIAKVDAALAIGDMIRDCLLDFAKRKDKQHDKGLQGTKKTATALTVTVIKSLSFVTPPQTFKRRSTTTKSRLVSYTMSGISASANLRQYIDKTKLSALIDDFKIDNAEDFIEAIGKCFPQQVERERRIDEHNKQVGYEEIKKPKSKYQLIDFSEFGVKILFRVSDHNIDSNNIEDDIEEAYSLAFKSKNSPNTFKANDVTVTEYVFLTENCDRDKYRRIAQNILNFLDTSEWNEDFVKHDFKNPDDKKPLSGTISPDQLALFGDEPQPKQSHYGLLFDEADAKWNLSSQDIALIDELQKEYSEQITANEPERNRRNAQLAYCLIKFLNGESDAVTKNLSSNWYFANKGYVNPEYGRYNYIADYLYHNPITRNIIRKYVPDLKGMSGSIKKMFEFLIELYKQRKADAEQPKAQPQPEPAKDEPQNASDTYRFAEELAKLYADGEKLDLSKAKAINRQNGYNFTTNQLMQACELAVVIRATQIAKGHDRPTTLKEKYDALVDLYSRQVTIQPKDSRASSLQQYSTPAPLAFLLGCFVDNWLRPNATRNYFEPTAGNGLLTIALEHRLTTVNELDDVRFHNLQQIGYQHCYNEDICNPSKDAYMLGINKEFAGVIMNPPFDKLDKNDFLTRKATIEGREATYTFERLDHKIAILSLEKMRDDGRAAIIIGGKMAVKLGDWKESYWKNGAIFGQYRTFITYLHRQYNIVDILYINGDLYRKQGTTFPIVAILIDGRTQWNDSREHQWHKFDELRDNQIDTFNELYLRLEKFAVNPDREANVANYRRLYEPQKADAPDRKRAQALLMLAKAKIKIAQAQQAQRMKQ